MRAIRRAGVLALVVAAHAVLLHGWPWSQPADRAQRPSTSLITVRLFDLPVTPASTTMDATPRQLPARDRRAVAEAVHTASPGAPNAAPPAATIEPSANTATSESLPEPLELQRSMRDAARALAREPAPPAQALAASSPGLGAAIAATSAPDCRTAYQSLGLLGLPLLALDALRERCR